MAATGSDAYEVVSDAPIETPDQDRLSRAQFAELLAQHILAYRSSESLVVALHGEWGSGKSSLLNLLAHSLTSDSEVTDPPLVVRFNPWYFHNTDDLLRAFFASVKKGGKAFGVIEQRRP